MQHDVADREFTRQHGGQLDSVVIAVWLGADDRDVVQIWSQAQQLLDGAHACHAVADNHQPGFDERTPCLRRQSAAGQGGAARQC